jgi:hypothetical protein
MAIIAAAFLTVGFTGILLLISDFVFGATAAAVVGSCTAAFLMTLWFVVPLRRRERD